MASGAGNAAKATQVHPKADQEPSMEEILASIKQIIADDEVPDDGLTERERYTHPSGHSNSNEQNQLDAEMQAAMEAEIRSLDTQWAGDAAAKPVTDLESRAAEVRGQLAAASEGLSVDERLEQYRNRNQLKMETLADQSQAKLNAKPDRVSLSPLSPAAAAAAVATAQQNAQSALAVPSTKAVAEEMAKLLSDEKSKEIETLLGDMMRPTVEQWLSNNLSTLVERLVREEIERVSRGRTAS